MPKWESSEAPVSVAVDDPDAFSGHKDDRPLELTVDAGERSLRAALTPGEAYHLVDDLQAAADACWGAAEYTVVALPGETADGRVLTTLKAPTPDDAVKRAVEYVQRAAEDDESFQTLATLAVEANRYQVFRTDCSTIVDDDSDNE